MRIAVVRTWNPLIAELMREAGSDEAWIHDEHELGIASWRKVNSLWIVAYDVKAESEDAMGKLRMVSVDGIGIISHVYTRPTYRTQGVATAMIKSAQAEFNRPVDKLLTASVIPDSHSYKAFMKNGFIELTQPKNGEVLVAWKSR